MKKGLKSPPPKKEEWLICHKTKSRSNCDEKKGKKKRSRRLGATLLLEGAAKYIWQLKWFQGRRFCNQFCTWVGTKEEGIKLKSFERELKCTRASSEFKFSVFKVGTLAWDRDRGRKRRCRERKKIISSFLYPPQCFFYGRVEHFSFQFISHMRRGEV